MLLVIFQDSGSDTLSGVSATGTVGNIGTASWSSNIEEGLGSNITLGAVGRITVSNTIAITGVQSYSYVNRPVARRFNEATGGSPWYPWEDYQVTIKVKGKKDKKEWVSQYNAGAHGLSYDDKVVVKQKGWIETLDKVVVVAKHKLINIRQIGVKVKK